MRDTVARHEVERPFGLEPMLGRKQPMTEQQRGIDDVDESADPRPVGGGPQHQIRLAQFQIIEQLQGRLVGVQDPMRVQYAFRLTGGAGRVHEERRVLGASDDWCQIIRQGSVTGKVDFQSVRHCGGCAASACAASGCAPSRTAASMLDAVAVREAVAVSGVAVSRADHHHMPQMLALPAHLAHPTPCGLMRNEHRRAGVDQDVADGVFAV